MKYIYDECSEQDIPTTVRFDTPGRNQGQFVEVQYGGWSRFMHDVGDPYKRVIDHSVGPGSIRWYRRQGKT